MRRSPPSHRRTHEPEPRELNLTIIPSPWVLLPGAAPALTRRQLEVIGHLSEGRSNKDIARALGVSPETVKSHVAQTLAAPNRTDAAVKGRMLGLVRSAACRRAGVLLWPRPRVGGRSADEP